MNWQLSHRFDRRALPIADSHYNRQKIGSPQFVPPGRCLVLLTRNEDALWVTSWPFPEFVRHAWPGAWINSLFCNRGPLLSSELILEALAVTRWLYGAPPPLGLITFVDSTKIKSTNPGFCYLQAGFRKRALCPDHMINPRWLNIDTRWPKFKPCAACDGKTKGGLRALQMLPGDMPEAARPYSAQRSLMELVA